MAKKFFISGTRELKWKNKERLYRVFAMAKKTDQTLELDDTQANHNEFIAKLQNAYAVILVSLGDISPNLILDAIRAGKPFVLTEENGLRDRIGDLALYCDPQNEEDIAHKILELSKPDIHQRQVDKIRNFSFRHNWTEIASEFLVLASNSKI